MAIGFSREYDKKLWLGDELMLFRLFHQKLKRNYRDYGFWTSWKKTTAYLFKPIYQKIIYYIYELDLNLGLEDRSQNSKYVFHVLDPSETDFIEQIEGMEEWLRGTLKQKLQENSVCMVVLDGTRVAGVNYVSIGKGSIPLLKLKIFIGANEAWSEQITISSDYRRKGLGSALRNHFYRELKSRGITALYGHRQEFNVASRKSARKYTANVLIRAEYVKVMGMNRLICVKHSGKMSEYQKRIHIPLYKHEQKVTGESLKKKSASHLFMARIEEFK